MPLTRCGRFGAVAALTVTLVAGAARAQETPAQPPTSAQSPAPAQPAANPTTFSSDAKAFCVTNVDRAQSLQTARKLKAAREAWVSCASEACPELVREDCAKSLEKLDATMPSIVFSATADGRDISDAKVFLDGDAIPSALDGHAVTIDPGAHVAKFERLGGGGTFEVHIVAREGEKNRLVTAAFMTMKPKKDRTEGARFPVVPVALAGVGVVALGGALFMRLRADSDAEDLHATCAPACDQSQRDSLSDKLVVSNIAFGVGVGALALAAAAWLFDSNR